MVGTFGFLHFFEVKCHHILVTHTIPKIHKQFVVSILFAGCLELILESDKVFLHAVTAP